MAPTVRSFSAEFDPLALIERHPQIYPGLLESGISADAAAGGGRFDILPIANGECLRLDGRGHLSGSHSANSGGFLNALESWWRTLRLPEQPTTTPFTGGWLLYLGYEVAAEIEPRLRLPPSTDPLIALAIRAPAAWVRDRGTGRGWLIAEPGYEHLLDEFSAHAADPPAAARASPRFDIREEDPEHFLQAVRRALEYIAAGDVYQTNLSRRWEGSAHGRDAQGVDCVALYRRLRAANPGPFAAILRDGDFTLMSSSPERLVSIRGGMVSTRPIAGTRPRGATSDQDAALIRTLLDNEKERAEHVMLIDLERNDLGRVCVAGSVQVDEYMSVESYAHVHHIVSNVSGRLRAETSPLAVIRALFPGGTITGCPKVRCMEIIAELEQIGRGAYTGSIGYLNRDGSLDLNILIRTFTADASKVTFRAGAGIVADSNAQQELGETRAKAEGLLRALRGVEGAR